MLERKVPVADRRKPQVGSSGEQIFIELSPLPGTMLCALQMLRVRGMRT